MATIAFILIPCLETILKKISLNLSSVLIAASAGKCITFLKFRLPRLDIRGLDFTEVPDVFSLTAYTADISYFGRYQPFSFLSSNEKYIG
jgi:hypothetical protein